MERYKLSKYIAENFDTVSNLKVKNFFFGIHSISSGSGSGVRTKNIEDVDVAILKELLEFFLESDLEMPQKYSVALTSKEKNGLKIPYIGKSSVGEIPGWLIPENYPIKNGKLHYIFEYFKI